MKSNFHPGDRKVYRRVVQTTDMASFHGKEVHHVCSTFALARDFEWASRLFFIDMMEEDEEGVGTHVSVDHLAPAFEGEEIIFTATVERINGMDLVCSIEACVGDRVVARGRTGQHMLKKEKLKKIFREQ